MGLPVFDSDLALAIADNGNSSTLSFGSVTLEGFGIAGDQLIHRGFTIALVYAW